jgi:lipoate-protein ligase A
MAIDHFLSKICQQHSSPILRIYGWEPYCISIGCHQKTDLIDFEKLHNESIDFVRRPTGGRAIYHAQELTYSFICPKRIIHHRDLYHLIHQLFADALNAIQFRVVLKTDNEKLGGLSHKANDFPCFIKSAQTEVQYGDKKLIGSAQKIYDQAILQHGSLLTGREHQRLPEFLNVSDYQLKVMQEEIIHKTICLSEISNGHINKEKIIKSIINQLESLRGISVNSRTLTPMEIESARKYEAQFSNPVVVGNTKFKSN